jgi:Protein of unknown function (DUF1552)
MNPPPAPLSRRTFLRGTGVALALPFLESMLPRSARAAAGPAMDRRRLIAISTTLGIYTPFLNPAETGRNYQLTPYLEPLRDFRQDLTVCSGLSHPEVDGGHSSEASFLTAAPHPGTATFRNSISLDQVAAEKLGGETRFASLVLTTGGVSNASLSWTRGGVMIPGEALPSRVFAKLFFKGSVRENATTARRLGEGRSIMDAINASATRLLRSTGKRDSEKLDEYFTSVRELEQRLVKNQAWSTRPRPEVSANPPADIADRADLIGRTRLMYDLAHLALQTDSTRIITLEVQGSGSVVPIPGVTEGHHNLSHHGRDPDKLEQLKAVERAGFEALADLLGKLRASTEEGSTLLDKTTVLFGSNLGNASSHDTRNLPILLAGGGFKHGQHLAFDPAKNAPLPNLYVSLLQRLGVETSTFASGTGTLTGLDFA